MRASRQIAALLVVAIAVGAAPASAGDSVETEITLKVGTLKQPPLFGRVSSDEPECVEGRRVAIVVPGEGVLDYADNRTNANGKWSFSSQLQGASRVQARVKQVKVEGTTCEGATSRVKSL